LKIRHSTIEENIAVNLHVKFNDGGL